MPTATTRKQRMRGGKAPAANLAAGARPRAGALFALGALALVWAALTASFRFVADDLAQILGNPTVTGLHWAAMWTAGTWQHMRGPASLAGPANVPYYRPVQVTFFGLEWALFGSHPAGYHSMEALLVAAAALLWGLALLTKEWAVLWPVVGLTLLLAQRAGDRVEYASACLRQGRSARPNTALASPGLSRSPGHVSSRFTGRGGDMLKHIPPGIRDILRRFWMTVPVFAAWLAVRHAEAPARPVRGIEGCRSGIRPACRSPGPGNGLPDSFGLARDWSH